MPRPSRQHAIRTAILDAMPDHPRDLVTHVSGSLGLSRPAVHAHVQHLVQAHYLKSSGSTRPEYDLGRRRLRMRRYALAGLREDEIWFRDFLPVTSGLSGSLVDILHYGFTEMVNNAVDHSDGTEVVVRLVGEWNRVAMFIEDDGIGIFRKIATHLNLTDERHALFELSKGKLTTDPSRHTGEGVFFTSRAFDAFDIHSRNVHYRHSTGADSDVLDQHDQDPGPGTGIVMSLQRGSKRTLRDVFSAFSSGPEDYAFARTVVPVRLAKLGNENLVSRSQGKRVLERVDRFRKVEFDFAQVEDVGQAFADEIFRVFALAHPDIELRAINASPAVTGMIRRAQSNLEQTA